MSQIKLPVIIFSLFFIFSGSLLALEIGEKLTEVSAPLKSVDGKVTNLKRAKGLKGTLVVFTCNHCPYVKKWQNRLTAIGNAYKAKGFGVIAINSNDPAAYEEDSLENMKKLIDGKLPQSKLVMNFSYVMDETSKVAQAFGAKKTPEFFLFNAKDELVYKGALDGDADNPDTKDQFLKFALDKTLKGEKLTPSEAFKPAFGCGIKFRKT